MTNGSTDMFTYTHLQHYKSRGARAMVLLHETHLKNFLATWRRARAAGIKLPQTDDPNYQSLDHLLHHLLRAARGYMVWICRVLELPDPNIESPPLPADVEGQADLYLTHLLEKWRLSLVDVENSRLDSPSYKSNWNMDYTIDSMLEHAVMHPIRHTFQLEELIAQQSTT
ncbi:MAG: hypothetical protein HY731_02990 [Candidatus Tectomicrobia bacterium]|nr:hypothetical protein [Candidatus Tectomicrobia bacterium]